MTSFKLDYFYEDHTLRYWGLGLQHVEFSDIVHPIRNDTLICGLPPPGLSFRRPGKGCAFISLNLQGISAVYHPELYTGPSASPEGRVSRKGENCGGRRAQLDYVNYFCHENFIIL